jgi:hypothetical protein
MRGYWELIGAPTSLRQKGMQSRPPFAWFPNWSMALNNICNLAEKEDWSKSISYGGLDNTGQLADYFAYLWRYIATTYSRQVDENLMSLIFSLEGEGERAVRGKFAVFDTGLLTRTTKEVIYALFERNRRWAGRDDLVNSPYVYKAW